MNILFLGGSTTDCDHCFTPDNLGTGYVKKLSLLPGITATNGGTDGFTFPDVLRKWRMMYAQNTYDCVVITCGINDVGVIADLEEAGRHEAACAFLADSMTALRTLLHELGGMSDMQESSPYRQRQNEIALPSANGTAQNRNNIAPPAVFPNMPEILLLEPFLFPIPQARILWLPILQDIRKRIQEAIASFHVAHSSISISKPASNLDTENPGKHSVLPETKSAYAKNKRCVRYVSTQAALDALVSELGYSAVTTDGIHLTDKGHEYLAKLVIDALGRI